MICIKCRQKFNSIRNEEICEDCAASIEMTKGRKIMELPVDKLIIDSSYQRNLDYSRVRSIAYNFDPIRLGIITIGEYEGRYYIVDGMHRVSALRLLGIEKVDCAVKEMTQSEQARYFSTQHERQRRITWADKFKADVAQGDPTATTVKRVVADCGYRMICGSNKLRPGEVSSPKTLTRIYTEYSETGLRDTLLFVAQAWPYEGIAGRSEILLGVAKFIYISKKQGKFMMNAMAEKLGKTSTEKILSIARARSLRNLHGDGGMVATVLIEQWNVNRRRDSDTYVQL